MKNQSLQLNHRHNQKRISSMKMMLHGDGLAPFGHALNQKVLQKRVSWQQLNFVLTIIDTDRTLSPFAEVPEKDAQTADNEVLLRRTQSFENDEKWVDTDELCSIVAILE